MKTPLSAGLMVVGLSGILSYGCTQMPTEKQGVSDLRPQLSFKITRDEMQAARVLVDGLDMGAVGDYLEGAAALRVLSGTHVIRIDLAGRIVVEDKVYVGDGVNRTILLK